MPQQSTLERQAVVDRTLLDVDRTPLSAFLERRQTNYGCRYLWSPPSPALDEPLWLRELEGRLELSSYTDTGRRHTNQTEDVPLEEKAHPQNTAIQNLIAHWAQVAVAHAIARRSDDPPGMIATVAGVEGAWGYGSTREESLNDLESVLNDWAAMKLRDGDKDIPSMEGVHLVVNR